MDSDQYEILGSIKVPVHIEISVKASSVLNFCEVSKIAHLALQSCAIFSNGRGKLGLFFIYYTYFYVIELLIFF